MMETGRKKWKAEKTLFLCNESFETSASLQTYGSGLEISSQRSQYSFFDK